MKQFPKLKPNQFALIRADINTGHLLDTDDKLKLDDQQSVYMIFESLESAIHFAKQKVESNNQIECVIYNARNEFIQRVDMFNLE